jgi:hypothetical protein
MENKYIHPSLQYIINGALDKANYDIDTMPYLKEIVDMDSSTQLESFKLLWLAFKNVIKHKIEAGKSIPLPFIGSIKIKPFNKIALDKKEIVANKLGYNSWINIPKDKFEKAEKDVHILFTEQIKANKEVLPVNKRRNNQVTRVLKLKLPHK